MTPENGINCRLWLTSIVWYPYSLPVGLCELDCWFSYLEDELLRTGVCHQWLQHIHKNSWGGKGCDWNYVLGCTPQIKTVCIFQIIAPSARPEVNCVVCVVTAATNLTSVNGLIVQAGWEAIHKHGHVYNGHTWCILAMSLQSHCNVTTISLPRHYNVIAISLQSPSQCNHHVTNATAMGLWWFSTQIVYSETLEPPALTSNHSIWNKTIESVQAQRRYLQWPTKHNIS